MTPSRVKCRLCGDRIDVVGDHLKVRHPNTSIGDYLKRYPRAPLFSKAEIVKRLSSGREMNWGPLRAQATNADKRRPGPLASAASMRQVFGVGRGARSERAGAQPIDVKVFAKRDFPDLEDFVPEIDANFLFDASLLRTVLLGLQMRIPVYLWGHAGAGKSSIFEQICARTNHPFLRVQHSANMEEAQVIGQYVFRDGQTVWEDGPLPFAMRRGMMYLADEYDFALPNVLSLYQPALEGKPLVIKEAPTELRIVRPHPEFRIVATGNTNGAGDDTGLYQGTTLQNFANFERFGVVEHVTYLPKRQETTALRARTGIEAEDASRLIGFAQEIRRAHDGGKLGATISLRALIHAAMLARGDKNWCSALALAFVNRLNATDREVCHQIAQRHFG